MRAFLRTEKILWRATEMDTVVAKTLIKIGIFFDKVAKPVIYN